MRMTGVALGVLLVALSGCGPTVGDACTTASDCGPGTCLQGSSFPGGYCALACSTQADCPNGTRCTGGACLLACTRDSDCRPGYTCAGAILSSRVCSGP